MILRGHDRKGFIIVTERNSRKYKDMMENPNVAATFYWYYRKPEDAVLTQRQVRITGTIAELPEDEIAKFYESEPTFYKIRSRITECGRPVDWNELKEAHDRVLGEVLSGSEKLPQNSS